MTTSTGKIGAIQKPSAFGLFKRPKNRLLPSNAVTIPTSPAVTPTIVNAAAETPFHLRIERASCSPAQFSGIAISTAVPSSANEIAFCRDSSG